MGRPVRRPIWCVLPCDHYPCLLLFSNFYIYILKEGGGGGRFPMEGKKSAGNKLYLYHGFLLYMGFVP